MSDEARLSYDELVAVLRTSTVLQCRADEQEFAHGELLEAARELGLSEAVVSRALELHGARRAAVAVAPKPFDTKITLDAAPERLVLDIPPRGFTTTSIPRIGFAIAWFSFLVFFMAESMRGSIGMTLFTIPFWIAGAAMLGTIVRPLVRRVRLELGPDEARLTFKPFGRTRALHSKVLSVRMSEVQRTRDEERESPPSEPTLDLLHGVQTFHLLEGYSDQERRWLEAELKAWLSRNAVDDAPAH